MALGGMTQAKTRRRLRSPARETRALTIGERKNRAGFRFGFDFVCSGGARLTPRFAETAGEANGARTKPVPAGKSCPPCDHA